MNDQSTKLQNLSEELNPFKEIINSDHFEKINDRIRRFKENIKDAEDTNRLLRIGIVGQIKVGKSSFLNALFFGGRDILPKAATPMTAALTGIRYAEENSAEIEFFSQEDWHAVENEAARAAGIEAAGLDLPESVKSCTELLDQSQGIHNINELLGTKKVLDGFSSIEEMTGELNNFVGSRGTYTALVKRSELRVNLESLKDVEIIDTPGLNDPIVSRSRRTQEEMGKCDAVFMLSRSGQFLSAEDIELLQNSLPAEGIRSQNIVLVCSQFDSVLQDVYTQDNHSGKDFVQLYKDMVTLKTKEAEKNFSVKAREDLQALEESCQEQLRQALRLESLKNQDPDNPQIIDLENQLNGQDSSYLQAELNAIKSNLSKMATRPAEDQSWAPLCISSMAHNIAEHWDSLNEEEKHTLERLKLIDPSYNLTADFLKGFAGIGRAAKRVEVFRASKDEILKDRLKALCDGAGKDAGLILDRILEEAQADYEALCSQDIASLTKQHQAVTGRIQNSRKNVDAIFDKAFVGMEKKFAELKLNIKADSKRAARVNSEERSETKTYEVSTSSWYNPFSWGSSETRTYTVNYTVASVSSTVEALENYVIKSEKELQNNILEGMNVAELRKDLILSIKKLFNDDDFDLQDILIPVQTAVDRISIPELDLDLDKHINTVRNKFDVSELRDEEIGKLRKESSRVAQLVTKDINAEVERYLKKTQKSVEKIQETFMPGLMKDFQERADKLKAQLKNKEEYKALYERLIQSVT